MGAVSIVEDMIERWDEALTESSIGPAGSEPRIVPSVLESAFERLEQAMNELDHSASFANHIDSWQSIARKIDEIHFRIERFNSQTLVSGSRKAIHQASQLISAELALAEKAWDRLSERIEPVVSKIAKCAVEVQRLNPDLLGRRLSEQHRLLERRANKIQGCWRKLCKLRRERVAEVDEHLAVSEAGRVMSLPDLPVTDKDNDLPGTQSAAWGRRIARK